MVDFTKLSEEDFNALADKRYSDISEQGMAVLQNKTVEEPSFWDAFSYAYDKTDTDVGNAATWLESRVPLGKVSFSFSDGFSYYSPEEIYGERFMDASPEVRRQVLNIAKEKELQQKYPRLSQMDSIPGIADELGVVTKVLSTPTSLIPAGSSVKGMAAIGSILGAEYVALENLAKEGAIDGEEVVVGAAVGAVAAPIVGTVLNKLSPSTRRSLRQRKDASARAQANESLDEIQDIVVQERANGVESYQEIQSSVMNKMGITKEALDDILIKSDIKLKVPSVEAAKGMLEMKSAALDPVAAKSSSSFVDNLLGTLSTRVKGISEEAFSRLRRLEYNVHLKTKQRMDEVSPFFKTLSQIPRAEKRSLTRSLYNGDFDDATSILKKYGADGSEFQQVQNTLEEIFGELKDAGYKELGEVENYFPRNVKDYRALLQKLGATERGAIENALRARAKQLKVSASNLPENERINIINQVLRGRRHYLSEGKISFANNRNIARISEEILDEYSSPEESLSLYIRKAVNDIEKRKFFGRDNAVDKGIVSLDLDNSIGNFVAREIDNAKISPARADELSGLLEARFNLGEASANKVMQGIRNIGYSTTIGNPISALTQVGDLGMSAYANGMRNTIGSLLGKKRVSMEELGLDSLIAEELSSMGKTARFLNGTLSAVGFKKIDKIGKNTLINSALKKAQRQSVSEAGIKSLRNKYGSVFGDEFKNLVDDLKAGDITDNVKYFLFNELSDFQPITLSEMPAAYLNNPNGRIFYSLKTFAIKQLDVIRRDIAQEFKKGNTSKAAKNLLGYMTIVPMMGASVDEVKDFLLGRRSSVEDIPDNYVENLFKVFGATEYIVDRYGKVGQVGSALGEMFTPVFPDLIDAVGTDMTKIFNGEFDTEDSKTLRQVPGVGIFWYNFFGGGLEKNYQERLTGR